MSQFSATIPPGGDISFEEHVGRDPIRVNIQGTGTPYTLNIETKEQGEDDTQYVQIDPLQAFGVENIAVTTERTFQTNQVADVVRLTATNPNDSQIDINGGLRRDGANDFYIRDGVEYARPEIAASTLDVDEQLSIPAVETIADLPDTDGDRAIAIVENENALYYEDGA